MSLAITVQRASAAALALAALTLWAPKPAAASSCSTQLGNLATFLSTKPDGPGEYFADTTVMNMNTSRSYSSYTEGPSSDAVLDYHPAANGYPAYIQDEGPNQNAPLQYFSERRYWVGLNSYPFNRTEVDMLGIKVYLADDAAKSINAGDTIFTLYSWGNGKKTMHSTCYAGMLYGFPSTDEIFTLHIKGIAIPNPPLKGHLQRPTVPALRR